MDDGIAASGAPARVGDAIANSRTSISPAASALYISALYAGMSVAFAVAAFHGQFCISFARRKRALVSAAKL